MKQLGIDISKATFDACFLNGNRSRAKKFKNNNEGFEDLIKWLGEGSFHDIHVCMEGTGKLWEKLAEFLQGKGFMVSVVNPMRVKGFGKSEMLRSKTDELDAALIARFCRALKPQLWTPKRPEVKAVRDRQRYVTELKAQITAENNRLLAGPLDEQVAARIRAHVCFMQSSVEEVEAEIRKLIDQDEQLKAQKSLLCSIIGIGETTANIILGELPEVSSFPNARAVELYCGIAPRNFESGSSVKARSRMSKVGNNKLRTALFFPALAAMRSSPNIQKFCDRLLSKNKPKMVIVGAVMRKLLRIIFAVLKSGKPFCADYNSNLMTAPGY